MVWHGAMLSAKWMHTRLWSGRLPSFHLVTQEEAAREKQVSELYFDSCRFADLRMQIRLKLKEFPIDAPSPGGLWDVLELFDEYLPLLLSIRRYHSVKPDGPTFPYLLTIFPPLFYGFGDLDLLSDRLVGKQQRLEFCIPVELVLVLYSMGQFHALHAESQARQRGEALTIAAWPNLQHAEISWQSAESFFRWAASYSQEMITKEMDPNDSSTRPIWKFFDAMAVNAAALSRLCSTHRLSTHLAGLSLTEIKVERLSRIGSICARRALSLIRGASSLLANRSQTSFSQQLGWCLGTYETRWAAIYYQSEMNIYKLDANPEIAIYFCEALLRLRTPQLPVVSSQIQDSSFSRCAHELQLLHHAHLANAIDLKKALLGACRDRFGTTWAFQALDKCVGRELLAVRDVGPVFHDEERVGESAVEEDEANYASPFLVDVIATNVEAALLNSNLNDPEPSAATEASASIVTKTPRPVTRSATCSNKGLTECRIVTPTPNAASQPDHKPKALSSSQLIKRPASATQPSSGWVTMSYGGKLLHFEKAMDSPQTTSAQDEPVVPRKAKPRPSSSPCYLSSKRFSNAEPVRASRQLESGNTWAPTRAPCALCERRFMRSSLPGVVLMKRIFDLRRKWGVIQDSKKYNAASALYGTANVCVFCQEILAYEEGKRPSDATDSTGLSQQQLNCEVERSAASTVGDPDKDAEVARMIHDSIVCRWHQQLSSRAEDNTLQDIAVNKRVRQSSTVCSMKAQNALDPDTNRSAHTKEEFQPWWEIDLANYVEVHSVKVYLRDEVSHLYAAAKGLAANPGRRTTGVYPLHISVSMKTGVGRDCDDIIASCVSSLCVTDKAAPPIEWVAPQKSRGRFVRIQCGGRAILHIERVHVYVAKTPVKVANDPLVMRQHVRQVLQRTAFRASVIATAATSASSGSSKVAVSAEPTPKRRMSTIAARRGSHVALTKDDSASQSLFFDPERAEKRRISRLYARFKSLLDARAKYAAPEEEEEEEEE